MLRTALPSPYVMLRTAKPSRSTIKTPQFMLMPPHIVRIFISRRVYSITAAAIAGGIFPLALAPLHIYPLAVISLLILFALWSQYDHPFTHGYVYGLSLFAIGVNWIHVSLHQFGNMQIAVAIFLTALLISYLALFPAAAGWLAVRLCRHKKILCCWLHLPV